MGLFSSKPERYDRTSKLRPQQEQLYEQLMASLQGGGAEGSFGQIADYYRGLLSGEGSAEFEKPLMRQFQEEIMPGISEQFAGLGAGGLSSGGFGMEQGRAATDLSERLGSLRASLREKGAQGLAGLAEGGFNQMDELSFRPREESFFEKFAGNAATGVGTAAGAAVGGPVGAAAGNMITSKFLEK